MVKLDEKLTYKGWSLHAYRHVFLPPYSDFCCHTKRTINGKTFSFYIEGSSLKQVVVKAKDKIGQRDYCVEWAGNLIPCKFDT